LALRSWRVWLGLAISLIFIWFAFRGQNYDLIWSSLRSAEYLWLLPALAAYFIGVGVRSVRWHYLLRPIQNIPSFQLFPIVVVGYLANNVLPFRAGEVVRAYALSARFHVRKSSALATIAVERIFDGITMLLFMLTASLTIAFTSDLRRLAFVATLLFAIITVVLFVMVFVPALRERTTAIAIAVLPDRFGERVQHMTDSFFEGLAILRNRHDLLSVALTSILAWLCEATMYLLVARAFALDISPSAVLLITAVANLATLIPSSPGYVGPFEAGVVLALNGALGVSRELALSYAVVLHAALYFPVTFLGLFFWWRESLSWREVRRAAVEEAVD
jgi:uncharacterized protein (TIRG00374 family)